jgi:hypothetical protein
MIATDGLISNIALESYRMAQDAYCNIETLIRHYGRWIYPLTLLVLYLRHHFATSNAPSLDSPLGQTCASLATELEPPHIENGKSVL